MEPLLEGPKGIDTLVLLENGKYENRTWGEGNYEIYGSEIHFIIQYPIVTPFLRTVLQHS